MKTMNMEVYDELADIHNTNWVLDAPSMVYTEEKVIETAEIDFVGRQLIAPKKIDYGKTDFKWVTTTAPTRSYIGGKGMNIPLRQGKKTNNYGTIWKFGAAFALTAEDLAAESDIDTFEAEEITHEIVRDEDEMIFIGMQDSDSTQLVNGLYNSATPTVAASNTWGSSSATPYEDVVDLLAAMAEKGYGHGAKGTLKMALGYENWGETLHMDANSVTAWDSIRNKTALQDVVITDKLTANTGMVCEVGERNAVLYLPQDIHVNAPAPMAETESFYVSIVMWSTPKVFQAYSVGTLTGL